MVYKYLLGQIHSSDLFFWVGFICCVNFSWKKHYGPFLWMGFNYPKATEPLRGGTLLFTTELPSILSFLKKLLPTIFQFSRIDSKFWCDVLRDLVPFVQIKNVKNTHGGVLLLLEVTLLHGCFLRFLNCTNRNKSRKTSLSKPIMR